MPTMHERTEKLHTLMRQHRLRCADVGRMVGRAPATVRIWRVGTDHGRVIPQNELELLELKLQQAAPGRPQ